jgi:uncharacterized protein (DUF58 family)
MAITGRAAAAALLGVVLALVSPRPVATVLVVDGAILVGIAIDLLLAGSVRALSFSRRGPSATRLGEAAPLVLSVANTGRRRVRAAVRDAWPPSAGASPRVQRVSVPAGERRRLEQTLLPTRRGDRVPFRVTVRSFGPLGLAARQGRHHAPWRLRVLPAFHSRRFLPEKLTRLRQIEGQVAARGRGQGTEFDSLREYVPGDDARAIDWRATARRTTVAVRTYRPERDRRVVAVLDTGRTSAGRVGDTPRLDHAMDATLLLAALASRAGDRVDLIAHDAFPRVSRPGGSRTADLLARLTEAMALLEPNLVEADHRAIVSAVLRATTRRSLVVLFTELVPAVIDDGLLPVLPSLTARHTVVLAAVRDPRLTELAAGRGDVRAVYGAAAAERTLAERRRLTAMLRGRGVHVVDAPPARFPSLVADAYLALKAAGQL